MDKSVVSPFFDSQCTTTTATTTTTTTTGFVQTLESHGIKMLRFPGLESPGKRHRSWETLEKSWNSKVVVHWSWKY